jgi:micrococcal nuclease
MFLQQKNRRNFMLKSLLKRDAKAEMVGLWKPQPTATRGFVQAAPKPSGNCDPSYPDVCIAPPPPDLDCKDIPYRRFRVLPPDPHNFDNDHDGIGCEK